MAVIMVQVQMVAIPGTMITRTDLLAEMAVRRWELAAVCAETITTAMQHKTAKDMTGLRGLEHMPMAITVGVPVTAKAAAHMVGVLLMVIQIMATNDFRIMTAAETELEAAKII